MRFFKSNYIILNTLLILFISILITLLTFYFKWVELLFNELIPILFTEIPGFFTHLFNGIIDNILIKYILSYILYILIFIWLHNIFYNKNLLKTWYIFTILYGIINSFHLILVILIGSYR